MNLSRFNYFEKLILSDLLGKEISDLYVFDTHLDREIETEFNRKMELLKSGYPVDYLLSEIDFLDLKIKVMDGVFIPRPETEEWLQKLITNYKLQITNSDFMVDLCSGTGIIGLYLAKKFPQNIAINIDISSSAIDNIKYNKNLNKIKNTKVVKSDLFEDFELRKTINESRNWVLFCNPPYVPNEDKGDVKKNNISFEPQEAIFAGEEGLSVFNKILNSVVLLNKKPYLCVFELDPRNINQAKTKLSTIYSTVEVMCDFNGFERVLVGLD